jgi:hypothetical protein
LFTERIGIGPGSKRTRTGNVVLFFSGLLEVKRLEVKVEILPKAAVNLVSLGETA